MKTLKHLLVIGLAFLIPTFPVAAGAPKLPANDPVFDQLLSHPDVLQAMHQAVTRHEGRLTEVKPGFGSGNGSSGTAHYQFIYKWAPWEAGTPIGGGSPVTDELGHFGVEARIENGTLVDVEVGEFFRVDD